MIFLNKIIGLFNRVLFSYKRSIKESYKIRIKSNKILIMTLCKLKIINKKNQILIINKYKKSIFLQDNFIRKIQISVLLIIGTGVFFLFFSVILKDNFRCFDKSAKLGDVIALIIILILIYFPMFFKYISTKLFKILYLFEWGIILISTYLLFELFNKPNFSYSFPAIPLLEGFIIYLIMAFLILVVGLIYIFLDIFVLNKIVLLRNPDAIVFESLEQILNLLLLNSKSKNALSYKNEIIDLLEKIAICFQKYFPKALHSKDRLTYYWLKNRSDKIAKAFREKKKSVLFPEHNTYQLLIKDVSNILFRFLNGNWSEIELSETEEEAIPYSRFNLLIRFFKKICFAVLPLTVVLFINKLKLGLEGDLLKYALLISIAWLMIIVLSLFDSVSNERIDALQKIIDLFRWKKEDRF